MVKDSQVPLQGLTECHYVPGTGNTEISPGLVNLRAAAVAGQLEGQQML